MQAHEAFKLGFIARCVEEGFTPEQTSMLAKQAEALHVKSGFADYASKQVTGPIQNAADAGKSVMSLGSSALPWLLGAAAIPPALGGVAAYLKNRAIDGGDKDEEVERVRQQELIDTYNRMSSQLKRQKELQDYKQQRKRTGRVFL